MYHYCYSFPLCTDYIIKYIDVAFILNSPLSDSSMKSKNDKSVYFTLIYFFSTALPLGRFKFLTYLIFLFSEDF